MRRRSSACEVLAVYLPPLMRPGDIALCPRCGQRAEVALAPEYPHDPHVLYVHPRP